MKEKTKKTEKILAFSMMDRYCILACIIVQYLLYIYFVALFIHYVAYPIQNLFNSPSLLLSKQKQTHYMYNALLYSLFYVQHIAMALIGFKTKCTKMWKKFPLYERYFFNIAASLTLIYSLNQAKPISNQNSVLFTTPNSWTMALGGIFLICHIISFLKMGFEVFHPYPFKSILTAQGIQLQSYTQVRQGIIKEGIYAYIRHPMLISFVGLIFFSSKIYTVDRIVFLFVNLLGVVLGTLSEQDKLRKYMKGYTQYQKAVKYRFIPYVL